jgi:hypothetical protein
MGPGGFVLIKSEGVLRYHRGEQGSYKLELRICNGIGMFYRSLIPKWYTVRRQKYDQHISVVRKEVPKNLELWGKYEGERVEFYYDPEDICTDGNYWWINCYSLRLEEIRRELGLKPKWSLREPPRPFGATFHTTIGNQKELPHEQDLDPRLQRCSHPGAPCPARRDGGHRADQ